MAVYYKFKSAKDYDSIPIDGHFISVLNLKEKIFESKHLGRGTDFDLVVTNAQTNEEYLEEAMLIPKNTSVLIRRVPGRPRMPIVTQPDMPKEEGNLEEPEPVKSSFLGADSSVGKYPDDSEWDEFGNDLYAIPEVVPVQTSNPTPDAPPPSKADEDSKIKALIDTPALDWQRQASDGFGGGRGFGRGVGGRMMAGRGFGRGGFERKTPPQGYICFRCKVLGHFIQHCPTNGDPNFDVKRVKPPTGIPKSMLMATPDGSYALPSGAVAVLKPNEAAFEKEIEGLPSTRSVGDLPPELHCPLCKEVMKGAVLTSKCCFNSFCDKCIREHIISKSMCVCGTTNVLTDDLLPNKTLRDTINRILESNNSSAENAGNTFQVPDMESARCPPPKVPSPNLSAASMGERLSLPHNEETTTIKDTPDEGKAASAPQLPSDKGRMAKAADISEAMLSISVKEPASQCSAPLPEEEVQQRASAEAGKKKKKKKAYLPVNALDMHWRPSQDLAAGNCMMPIGPSAYNPYWNGMQPGMEGYMAPYAAPMPYANYGLGLFDMPFAGIIPQDPFGAQGYILPGVLPQRDLAEFGIGLNTGPPVMSREEFEARKADLRRKREFERRGEMREPSKDQEFGRKASSNGDISMMKSKSAPIPPPSASSDHHHRHNNRLRLPERSPPDRYNRNPTEPPRLPKRKSADHQQQQHDNNNNHRDQRHHRSESSAKPSSAAEDKSTAAAAADRKHKASVFSRISLPPNGYHEDGKPAKAAVPVSSGSGIGRKGNGGGADCESSDDDRHFKRRPTRYEPSPPPPEAAVAVNEERRGRHSKGSRKRERERGSGR